MKRVILLTIAAFIATVSMAANQPSHPAFIFSQEELGQVRENTKAPEWRADMYNILVKDAKKMLSISTNPYIDNLTNGSSKKAWDGIGGRRFGVRIISLAFAGYVNEEQKYIDKAREMLLSVVRIAEPYDKKFWRTHLQVGDAAQAICLGYDLLYPYMSKKERAEVLEEIKKYGEHLYSGGTYSAKDAASMSSNHNSVHYGALGLCALVTDNEEWLNKAIAQVEGFYRHCADQTGYITESHHYQSYGLGGAVPFSIALQRVKGVDLIAKYKGLFDKFGDQITWAMLPDNTMTTINDTAFRPSGDMSAMGAVLYDHPEQLWSWLKSNETPDDDQKYLSAQEGLPYTRCYLFLPIAKYVTPRSPKEMEMPLVREYESGRVFARSGWGSINDAHLSFTSGYDHHHGHNHADENSITLYAFGDTFIYDPGYMPTWSNCHTTLLINGEEQWIAKGSGSHTVGKVEQVREDECGVFIRGEAKGAYKKDKGIKSSSRKLYFMRDEATNPYIIWRDDVAMVDGSAVDVVTRVVTPPTSTIYKNKSGLTISGKCGASALVLCYSGAQRVEMSEDDLSTESSKRKGQEIYSREYFKRISASVKESENPRLTTIVLPYTKKSQLPEVEVSEVEDSIIYKLTYQNGKVHTIELTKESITTNIE